MLPDTLKQMLQYYGTGQANTQMSPELARAMAASPSSMRMSPELSAVMSAHPSSMQMSPELSAVMGARRQAPTQLTPALSAAMAQRPRGQMYPQGQMTQARAPQMPLPQMARAMASAPQNMSAWGPAGAQGAAQPYRFTRGYTSPYYKGGSVRISPELADLANQILDSEATGDPKLAMDWANEQLGNPRGPGVAPQGAGLMPSGRPYTNITDLVRETNPGLRPRPRNAVSLSQWRKGR